MKKDVTQALEHLLANAVACEFPTKHYFSSGICIREMEMPKGSLLVGHKHKTDHITMLIKGSMQIRIGEESKIIHAPYTFEALAGSRKIGLAYTDCVVSNIFPTDSTDIEEIEREFTDKHDLKEIPCQ